MGSDKNKHDIFGAGCILLTKQLAAQQPPPPPPPHFL